MNMDQLWEVAKREGLKHREDLGRLDLSSVQTAPNGRLIVPPLLFSQQRAMHPNLFKRAGEMSPSERQEFVRTAKANTAASEEAKKAPRDHVPHPKHANHHVPMNRSR